MTSTASGISMQRLRTQQCIVVEYKAMDTGYWGSSRFILAKNSIFRGLKTGEEEGN